MDSVILAACAARLAAGRDVLDACAGVGVVGLALRWLCRDGVAPRSLTAVELQPELASLAAYNARGNDLAMDVVVGDLRAPPLRDASFGLVVANPPYREAGTGRVAPEGGRALGRHELALPARELFSAVARLLAPGGRVLTLCLAEREPEMLEHARRVGLLACAVTRVRPKRDAPPNSCVLDLRSGPDFAGPRLESELVLHEASRCWTPPVAALLERGDLSAVQGCAGPPH